MTIKLFCNAIIKFVLGIILVGLLLFLPAGTVQYPNGWLLMGVLFVPMFVAGWLCDASVVSFPCWPEVIRVFFAMVKWQN